MRPQMFKGPSFVFEIEGSRDREILLYIDLELALTSSHLLTVYDKSLNDDWRLDVRS